MNTRGSLIGAIAVLCLLMLFATLPAQAQGRDHPRDPEFPGRVSNGQYDRARLRETVRRLVNHSRNFQNAVDNSLDRSKLDGTRLEDRVNYQAQRLHSAAVDLRNRLGDARDLNSSADEARKTLEVGSRLDNFVGRGKVDLRTKAFWDQIREDLRVISNAYGFRTGEFLNNNGR